MLGLKLNHVRKSGPRCQLWLAKVWCCMFNVSLHLILTPAVFSVFMKQPGDLLQLCHQSFLNPWYHIPSRLLNTLLQGALLCAMMCHQHGITITEASHEHHGISNNRKLHHLFNNLFRLTAIQIHFRLRCCPCPILWGWQHQAMLNTCSPCISVFRVSARQATIWLTTKEAPELHMTSPMLGCPKKGQWCGKHAHALMSSCYVKNYNSVQNCSNSSVLPRGYCSLALKPSKWCKSNVEIARILNPFKVVHGFITVQSNQLYSM